MNEKLQHRDGGTDDKAKEIIERQRIDAELAETKREVADMRSRIGELAANGDVSGQVAHYLLEGEWAKDATQGASE